MSMKEFVKAARMFGWWNMILSTWKVFSFRFTWAVRNYGLISALWRAFQRYISKIIQIDFVYKNRLDVSSASREKVAEYGPELKYGDLEPEEIYEKEHYFDELKLSHMRERVSRGVRIFCLLSEDESEILGYIHWVPRSYYDDNMSMMVQLDKESVYGVELSVNIKHRGRNLGNCIQQALAFHLKELGYRYMITFTRYDNLQSLAVQKRVGMEVVQKYFRAWVSFGTVFPMGRDLSKAAPKKPGPETFSGPAGEASGGADQGRSGA